MNKKDYKNLGFFIILISIYFFVYFVFIAILGDGPFFPKVKGNYFIFLILDYFAFVIGLILYLGREKIERFFR